MIDQSHYFGPEDRCMWCDCRPWGAWAQIPCGSDQTPPQMTFEQFQAGAVVWTAIKEMTP